MKINFYNNSVLNVYINNGFIKTWWEIFDQFNNPVIYEIDEDEINKYFLQYQLTDTLLKIYQSGNKYLIKVIKNDNIKEILVENNCLQRSLK